MASITKRCDKYRALVRITGQRSLSKTFSLKADAQAWAKLIESQIERGLFLDHSEAQQTTLAKLLERYEEEILPTKKSQAQVKSVIKLLTKELGSLSLVAVTPSLLSSYRNKRMKSVGPQTTRHDLSLLSRAFNVAIKDWGHYCPVKTRTRTIG